jgi:hypothetical protein
MGVYHWGGWEDWPGARLGRALDACWWHVVGGVLHGARVASRPADTRCAGATGQRRDGDGGLLSRFVGPQSCEKSMQAGVEHAKGVASVCLSSGHTTRRHLDTGIELNLVRIGIKTDPIMLFDLREKPRKEGE